MPSSCCCKEHTVSISNPSNCPHPHTTSTPGQRLRGHGRGCEKIDLFQSFMYTFLEISICVTLKQIGNVVFSPASQEPTTPPPPHPHTHTLTHPPTHPPWGWWASNSSLYCSPEEVHTTQHILTAQFILSAAKVAPADSEAAQALMHLCCRLYENGGPWHRDPSVP